MLNRFYEDINKMSFPTFSQVFLPKIAISHKNYSMFFSVRLPQKGQLSGTLGSGGVALTMVLRFEIKVTLTALKSIL